MFLEEPIQVIDGLEFSEEYRTIDQLDELCFFAMECEKLGAHALAREVLQCYRMQSSEPVQDALIDFYKGYRIEI